MTARTSLTLAIIPARGGSKGLPRKNLERVGEHTLLAWAIRAAQQVSNVSKTLVNTDCNEIAREATSQGAEVFARPSYLATDTATSVDVAIHCLEVLEEEERLKPDWLLLLQPTSPLRTAQDIQQAFLLAQENNCQAVVSVTTPSHHPLLAKTCNSHGYLTPLFSNSQSRRQDLPKVVQPNGAIYLVKTEALVQERSFYPDRTVPYMMPPERSIDIDTAYDLKIARHLVK